MPDIPELPEGQDEIVMGIVLRRADQPNPSGDAAGDMGGLLAQVPPPVVVDALVAICGYYGFDPELSYAGVVSVAEVEGASQPATLAQLQAANLGE
jgi:hypothetical protein